MDSLLSGLFGGQDDAGQQRGKAEDFINRYQQGAPWDNISDDEAVQNYQAVASRMSPQELEESAAETYEQLSPEERQQFAQWLQEREGGRLGQIDANDPRQLAHLTTEIQQQQPDGLAGLLGGGSGGLNSLLGGALGGGQGQGNMLQNPIAKAVLGGIAAMAMKKLMGGR